MLKDLALQLFSTMEFNGEFLTELFVFVMLIDLFALFFDFVRGWK